jgi:hydroxymethylglutaryl-CoA synthase
MTDTPDFWRREYEHYPQHAGRYTGEPAYFKHTLGAAQGIMKLSGLTPKDIDWYVGHQPNGKFPLRAAQMLGFPKEKIEPGWLVPKLGNTYSGASPIGLTATLDIAKPGDVILMVSYGSGSGSDAFIFKVTERINEIRDRAEQTRKMLEYKPIYLDYGSYAKFRKKILKNK